jgi:replication initiation and membrane attachment protein DnaB
VTTEGKRISNTTKTKVVKSSSKSIKKLRLKKLANQSKNKKKSKPEISVSNPPITHEVITNDNNDDEYEDELEEIENIFPLDIIPEFLIDEDEEPPINGIENFWTPW